MVIPFISEVCSIIEKLNQVDASAFSGTQSSLNFKICKGVYSTMKHVIQMLLYENGGLSLTRTIALIFVLLFVFVTIFLVYFDMTWGAF